MAKHIIVIILSLAAVILMRGLVYSQDYAIRIEHPRIIINSDIKQQLKSKFSGPKSEFIDSYNKFLKDQKNRPKDFTKYPNDISATLLWTYSFGLAYQMTGEQAYADSIITLTNPLPEGVCNTPQKPTVLHVVSGPCMVADYDRRAQALEILAISYDWFYDYIEQVGKKEQYINLIKEFVKLSQDDYKSMVFADYHNYGVEFPNAVLMAGLALYGDAPEAQSYIDWALSIIRGGYTFNYNGDLSEYNLTESLKATEGGANWEGISYQETSLQKIVRMAAAWESATGEDLFQGVNLENSGYLTVYLTAPNNKKIRVGADGTFYSSLSWQILNPLAYLENKYQNPYFKDWLDSHWPIVPKDYVMRAQALYFLWYDPAVNSQSFSDLSPSVKIGDYFILRSGWEPDAVIITFKAGYHWGHHDHYDHNSFTLFKYAPLAIDSGYYNNSYPVHMQSYFRRTVAHNAIIVTDPNEIWRSGSGYSWNGHSSIISNDGGQRIAGFRYNPPYNFSAISGIEALSKPYLDLRKEVFQMAEVKNFELMADYDYIKSDGTRGFNNNYSGQGNNTNRRVSQATRELVYLRPNYLIILDRINSANATFQKSWLLHSVYAPQVRQNNNFISSESGLNEYYSDLARIDNGNGRLYSKTLLPDSLKLGTVGGAGYEFWVDGANASTKPDITSSYPEAGSWRIEVKPALAQEDDLFLHVLYPCESSVNEMPETMSIDITSGNMAGALIKDVSPRIVMFSKTESPQNEVTYQADYTGTAKHLIVDMQEGNYSIYKDGILIGTKTCSSQGTFYFEAAGGGNFQVARTGIIPEDINGDGEVNIEDLQLCVNVVLGIETKVGIVLRADVNGDEQVDVSDVQEIVNKILGG